jgi:two-component system, OmpR family, response regulator MtrA
MDERVLLVEDDPSVRESAGLVLERAGMRVTGEGDGAAAVKRFWQQAFDLVVLDLMLPGMSGFDVCREIRATSSVPIVILTARTDTADLVAGLELGADDYITKPLDGDELVARIRAVLRRARPESDDRPVRTDDIEVDPRAFKAFKAGEQLELTTTEFRLLFELVRHTGHVLSRDVLLRRVWNYDYLGESRLVDMAVKRLREKIEDDPSNPARLVTVRGVGYRYERL